MNKKNNVINGTLLVFLVSLPQLPHYLFDTSIFSERVK